MHTSQFHNTLEHMQTMEEDSFQHQAEQAKKLDIFMEAGKTLHKLVNKPLALHKNEAVFKINCSFVFLCNLYLN